MHKKCSDPIKGKSINFHALLFFFGGGRLELIKNCNLGINFLVYRLKFFKYHNEKCIMHNPYPCIHNSCMSAQFIDQSETFVRSLNGSIFNV
jgi:hypothetical protein